VSLATLPAVEVDAAWIETVTPSLARGARQQSEVRAREVVDDVGKRFLGPEIRVNDAALEPPGRRAGSFP